MSAVRAFLACLLLAAAPAAAADFYEICPLDLLQITVYDQPDLTVEVRVGEDGMVGLPLVGPVPASGRTLEGFTRELAERYGEFLVSPQVTVFVKEFHGLEISVLGEVTHPGLYRFKGRATLLEAISLAGGLTPESGDQVSVLRRVRDGDRRESDTQVVSTGELFSPENREAANVELRDGDTVHVPKSPPGLGISVLGAVARPGLYRFKEKTTLLEAVFKAGGLTQESGERVSVHRRAREGDAAGPETVSIDTTALFSPEGGGTADLELRDGDTVHVARESPGLEVSVLGEVARPGRYRLRDKAVLLDALSHAGGLTQESGERVIVLRPGGAGAGHDMDATIVGTPELFSPAGMKEANIELRDGDTVHVPRAEHYFVFGEVTRPGSYKIEKGSTVTVLKAIGLAGGFTDKAARREVRITREEGGKKSVVKATLDTPVRSQDVIIVPESFF